MDPRAGAGPALLLEPHVALTRIDPKLVWVYDVVLKCPSKLKNLPYREARTYVPQHELRTGNMIALVSELRMGYSSRAAYLKTTDRLWRALELRPSSAHGCELDIASLTSSGFKWQIEHIEP